MWALKLVGVVLRQARLVCNAQIPALSFTLLLLVQRSNSQVLVRAGILLVLISSPLGMCFWSMTAQVVWLLRECSQLTLRQRI